MGYRFHKCQTHPKCPNLTGWYLEIQPGDLDTLMKVHKGVAGAYYAKYGMDPHASSFYNPVKLATSWLLSVNRLLSSGLTVLVNFNGGILPDGKILETVESDNIDWDIRYDDEIITIAQWPDGKHYYLCSSKFRIFVPGRYNTFESAYEEALRYVPKEHIQTRNY
jgi:hypothetical protein